MSLSKQKLDIKPGQKIKIELEWYYRDETKSDDYSLITHGKHADSYMFRQIKFEHSQYFTLKYNIKDGMCGGYLTCIFPADHVHLTYP